MAGKHLTKQEIQEWILFLYSDLLKDNIYIGGYYFNLDQLKDFDFKKDILNAKTESILRRIKLKNKQLSKEKEKTSYSALQQSQNEDFKKLNELSVMIKMKNKYNEIIEFPVLQEEFFFIYNELKKAELDINHFKNFLLEELNSEDIKETDSEFMLFINDYLNDLREQFAGTKRRKSKIN